LSYAGSDLDRSQYAKVRKVKQEDSLEKSFTLFSTYQNVRSYSSPEATTG
jgi:hypothetical protein